MEMGLAKGHLDHWDSAATSYQRVSVCCEP